MNKCVVVRLDNLQTKFSVHKQKWYQTFDVAIGNTIKKLVTGCHYAAGTLGVYIPPGAIIPDDIAKEMWLFDKLAGKKKNRVASKLMFGEMSDGIFYARWCIDDGGFVVSSEKWQDSWAEGKDVTSELGVTFKDA